MSGPASHAYNQYKSHAYREAERLQMILLPSLVCMRTPHESSGPNSRSNNEGPFLYLLLPDDPAVRRLDADVDQARSVTRRACLGKSLAAFNPAGTRSCDGPSSVCTYSLQEIVLCCWHAPHSNMLHGADVSRDFAVTMMHDPPSWCGRPAEHASGGPGRFVAHEGCCADACCKSAQREARSSSR